MLLILLPYFSNARVGTALGERDLQALHQGEDELWEAQFIADRRALVARMKKEQLEKQRDESRKLETAVTSQYAEKRMRLHKSGKTHTPTGSPTSAPTGSPTVPPPTSSPTVPPPTSSPTVPPTSAPTAPTNPPTTSPTKTGKASPDGRR